MSHRMPIFTHHFAKTVLKEIKRGDITEAEVTALEEALKKTSQTSGRRQVLVWGLSLAACCNLFVFYLFGMIYEYNAQSHMPDDMLGSLALGRHPWLVSFLLGIDVIVVLAIGLSKAFDRSDE